MIELPQKVSQRTRNSELKKKVKGSISDPQNHNTVLSL